jgi:hypothetical protein
MEHTASLRDQGWVEGTAPPEAVIWYCSLARIDSGTVSEHGWLVSIRIVASSRAYLAAICSDEFDL